MRAVANVLTGLVALSHIGFLVLEMFFWDHPVGRRIFGMTPEVSASIRVTPSGAATCLALLREALRGALGSPSFPAA